jgi:hypothetical protein
MHSVARILLGLALGLGLWAAVSCGNSLGYEPTARASQPSEPTRGGSLLFARQTTFRVLKTMEARGHTVDRSNLHVRVIFPGYQCDSVHITACATINFYTGRRDIWYSRSLVRNHGWVKVPGLARRPTCLLWEIAVHELLHHERSFKRRQDGAWVQFSDAEIAIDHLWIVRQSRLYAGFARRSGRCVDDGG